MIINHVDLIFIATIVNLWGTVCAKINIHVVFIFPVGIHGIHDGNLLKSPLDGHSCSEIY